MKRIAVFVCILALLPSLGCENRLFTYTVSISQSSNYVLAEPGGTFTKSGIISRASVARALGLPDGARVTELKIESLSIQVIVANTNQANAITVSGVISRSAGQSERLFDRQTITIGGPGGGLAGETEVALNLLIAAGISHLQRELENFVKGLGSTSFVEIALAGFSTPSGTRIDLTLLLNIKASVKYERCEEILKGMSDAPSCDGGGTVSP